jgi:hypothetical protein
MKLRKRLQNELVTAYEDACGDLSMEFVNKYFGKDVDARWVAREPGGVLEVNDHYFSVSHIYEALKFGITRAQLFAWYDDSLTPQDDHMRISLRNWRYIKVK